MKRISSLLILFSAILIFSSVHAQEAKPSSPPTKEKILAEGRPKDIFDKKFRLGVSYHFNWGTIKGDDLPKRYFIKPCVGFNVRAEYYPLSFIGIGAGIGYQQRGAGVRNPDNYGGSFAHPWVKPTGDVDSTYIQKLRFNTWELPITLLLRTPNDVIKGVRLSAAAGVIFINNFRVNDIWLDVAGGNHLEHRVTSDYLRNDVGYQFSIGPDINAGYSNIFQVHFVYTKGMSNIYNAGQGDGRQITYGIRVAWLM